MKTTADAVIVGGGVMGCSILWNLARMGMSGSVVIERGSLGSGSTSRTMGILRMHYSNEVTTRMAWDSLKVLQQFEDVVGGPSGYVRTGYLLIAGEGDRPALEANVAMQKTAGVDTQIMGPEQVAETYPMVSLGEDEVCAHEPESGYADSHSVTQGYARRARDMGARVITETAVEGVEVRGGRVTGVVTESGTIATPVAVVAAGPWSRPFLGKLGVHVPLETVRHQVVSLNRPVDRLPGHPTIGDLANDLSARPDGRDMTLVGVGEEERVGPDSYDQGVDMEVVQDTWARLATRIPGLEDAEYRGGWSGLFTTTPDWHPILGPVEGIEGLYCAVGFSGHGFKLAPMIGVAMAEIITRGRASTIDVSMLGLDRFKTGKPMTSRYGMAVLA